MCEIINDNTTDSKYKEKVIPKSFINWTFLSILKEVIA